MSIGVTDSVIGSQQIYSQQLMNTSGKPVTLGSLLWKRVRMRLDVEAKQSGKTRAFVLVSV